MGDMTTYPVGYEHVCSRLDLSKLDTYQKCLIPVHWSVMTYPGRTFRLLSNNTHTEMINQDTLQNAKIPFELTYHDKVGTLQLHVQDAVPGEAILVSFIIKDLREMCVVNYKGLVKDSGEGVDAFDPNGVWICLDLLVDAIKKICNEHYDMVKVKMDSSRNPYTSNIPVVRPRRLDGPEVPRPGDPPPRGMYAVPGYPDPGHRYGDMDLDPVGGFRGGMVMDPRGFGSHGVNPPRFDPIGPGMPRGGRRGDGDNYNNLAFGIPNPDHERRPPGLDDMFM